MNRLSDATSPYLLQHAGHPVDWAPWSAEAFAEARARDGPVRGEAPGEGVGALGDKAGAGGAAASHPRRGGSAGPPRSPPRMVREFLPRHSERPGAGRDGEKPGPADGSGGEAGGAPGGDV